MKYQTIVLTLVGMNNGQIASAMDSQLNRVADDGYRFQYAFTADNKMFIIMVQNEIRRGPGRPRKSEGDEVDSMEG